MLLTDSRTRVRHIQPGNNVDFDKPTQAENDPTTHDPYRALRFRNFRFLFLGTFIAAIGWELYDRTHGLRNELALCSKMQETHR